MNKQAVGSALCGLMLMAAGVRGEEYRDVSRHFSLTLPKSWTKMDPSFVAQMNKFIQQRLPEKNITYDTGFQPRHKQQGEYPYILVQWYTGAPPRSYEAIERGLILENGNKTIIKQVEGAMSDITKNVSLDAIAVDRIRNRTVQRIQSEVAGVGKVQGLSVGFLGKDGIASVHCYDREADFDKSLSSFNTLLDSFQYDVGYAYQPSSSSIDWSSVRGSSLIGGIVGGAIGGLVALLVALKKILSKQKKSDPAV